MTKINSERGEVEFAHGDISIRLVPSMENIGAVERDTGLGVYALVDTFRTNIFTTDQLLSVIKRTSDPVTDNETISQIVNAGGIARAAAAVGAVLLSVVVGGEDADSLRQAAEKKAKSRGKSPGKRAATRRKKA